MTWIEPNASIIVRLFSHQIKTCVKFRVCSCNYPKVVQLWPGWQTDCLLSFDLLEWLHLVPWDGSSYEKGFLFFVPRFLHTNRQKAAVFRFWSSHASVDETKLGSICACRAESHLMEDDAPLLQSPRLTPLCWLKLNQLHLTSVIAIIAAPAGEKRMTAPA